MKYINKVKHLLIILSIFLLSSPLFGQSEKPQTIIIPTGSLGEMSKVRIKILEKTLESKLDDYFAIVPKELFEEAKEEAFQEMDSDECTEDQCILMIKEILQIGNAFKMELLSEDGDTQISITWNDQDQKRVEEDYCEGCKTKELRLMIGVLVEKLVGYVGVTKEKLVKKIKTVELEKKTDKLKEEVTEKEILELLEKVASGEISEEGATIILKGKTKLSSEGIAKLIGKTKAIQKETEELAEKLMEGNKIEVKVEEPVVVVDKKQKGVLFNSKRNGQWEWFKDGDEKKDGKFLGEIENGIPNGQGTVTWTEHGKYVGEWKDGDQWNGTDYYKNGNVKGKYVNGKGKYVEQ